MQKGQIYQNFSIKEYTDVPSKLAQIVTSTGKDLKGQYGNDYHVMIHQVIHKKRATYMAVLFMRVKQLTSTSDTVGEVRKCLET
ncbi:hypothetical protein J2S05_003711 [Alkalicoccobacillus murimartini]|uniref:Uncharacterized protein n=1 Tax=Alkalicoccobacillus murimartini TaxID=171685 RepID=A0ABT9YNV0_9BACI|nr:hypothetical protein [Alkalicoccobacillus murimartini]